MPLNSTHRAGFKRAAGCLSACLCFFAAMCADLPAQKVDVLTQHNDNSRNGANLQETYLTPRNVNDTQFGMLFKRLLDDQLYTQPLVATGVKTDEGTRLEEHTLNSSHANISYA